MSILRRLPMSRSIALLARRFADAVLGPEDPPNSIKVAAAPASSGDAAPPEDAPRAAVGGGGPPAHWLAYVAERAPHLVRGGAIAEEALVGADLRAEEGAASIELPLPPSRDGRDERPTGSARDADALRSPSYGDPRREAPRGASSRSGDHRPRTGEAPATPTATPVTSGHPRGGPPVFDEPRRRSAVGPVDLEKEPEAPPAPARPSLKVIHPEPILAAEAAPPVSEPIQSPVPAAPREPAWEERALEPVKEPVIKPVAPPKGAPRESPIAPASAGQPSRDRADKPARAGAPAPVLGATLRAPDEVAHQPPEFQDVWPSVPPEPLEAPPPPAPPKKPAPPTPVYARSTGPIHPFAAPAPARLERSAAPQSAAPPSWPRSSQGASSIESSAPRRLVEERDLFPELPAPLDYAVAPPPGIDLEVFAGRAERLEKEQRGDW